MTKIGVFISTEEHSASECLDMARRAEAIGVESCWVSDHFHPWNHEQGEAPFVWSVLGAIAAVTSTLRVHTAVTCPTMRIHPAVIAQAAATTATLMPGRFGLGLGSGEALNEHIFGDTWPNADERLDMLEESVELIRELWTGENVHHDGPHYRVENARIFSLPDELPPIHISAFGPKALELAARIGDGFMNVTPEMAREYRELGGKGTTHGGVKVVAGADKEHCIDEAYRLWPNMGLPGELAQILPTVAHFEQATELVTREMIADSLSTGPDPEEHLAAIREYADAGFDEVYVSQIGYDQDAFFTLMEEHVLPAFG